MTTLSSRHGTATIRRFIGIAGLCSLLTVQVALGAGQYPTVTDVSATMRQGTVHAPAGPRAPALLSRVSIAPHYQNLPGFQCHYWNARGECMNYSYYNFGYDGGSPAYPPPAPASGRLTVRVTGAPDPVEEGDIITYHVYLKNNESRARTVDVLAELDDAVDFRSASDGGEDNRKDEVEWDNVRLAARGSDTLTLKVRVNSRADDGDTIFLRVEADGATDEEEIEVDDDRDDDCYYRSGRYYCDDEDDEEIDYDCSYRSGRYHCDNGTYDYCERAGSNRYSCTNDRDDDDNDDEQLDYDCVYRSGRYDCEDGTYDYCYRDRGNRYYCRDDDDDKDISVSVTDAPDPVLEDGLITYTIDVSASSANLRYIDVYADIDPDTTFYSASGNGMLYRAHEVRWRDVVVNRYTDQRLTLTVRADDARDGDRLRIVVRAGDDEDEEETRVRD